jgi:hypothetical protein
LATEGESCWRFREYDAEGWTGGAGIGNSTDSEGIAALLDTVVVDVTNTVGGDVYTFVVNTPAGINALTNWAAGGDNAGLLMTTDEGPVFKGQNAIYFGSKENSNSNYRPEMIVHTTTGDVSFGAADDNLIWNGPYYEVRNYGSLERMIIGKNAADWPYRGLMRFDLEPLRAAYNVLTGAELTLTVTSVGRINAGLGNLEFKLFLLDDSNAGWVEGSGDDRPSLPGESCWEYLSYPDTSWVGGKGIGNSTDSAGISNLLASVMIDTSTVVVGQKIVLQLDSPTALAILERWINGGINAGLLLTTDETAAGQNALEVASSENSDPAKHPELKINYTADVTTFEPAGDNFMYNGGADLRNWNWGAWTTPQLAIGLNSAAATYRTLMRFDLSTLNTTHKRIKAAKLTVTQANNSKIKPASGATFETRLLLPVLDNADWVEGTKSAATAGAGESCWNWKKYATDAWVGGDGIGIDVSSAGVAAQLATALVNAETIAVGDKIIYYIESEAGLAILERWADGGVNEGFLLTTDEASSGQNAVMIGSREHPTQSYRPVLTILLEPVIPQGTIMLLR